MSLALCAMIVSTAIVVLPVARSPMISSRWPRPSANSVSIARMPVCTGSVTASRAMISGAGRSTGICASASIGPLPSSGRPSGSTIRPSRPGPTGTRTTSPLPRTVSPALTASTSSNSTHPMRSGSRTCAKPNWPPENRSSSSRRASGRPETKAMPSATSSTRPMLSTLGPSGAAATLSACPLQPCLGRSGVVRTHGRVPCCMRSRSARQLLARVKCGPCSSSPAISLGIGLEAQHGRCRRKLGDRVGDHFLLLRGGLGGRDCRERPACANGIARRIRKISSIAFRSQSRKLDSTAGPASRADSLAGDLDRQPAGPIGPGLLLRLARCLCRAPGGCFDLGGLAAGRSRGWRRAASRRPRARSRGSPRVRRQSRRAYRRSSSPHRPVPCAAPRPRQAWPPPRPAASR